MAYIVAESYQRMEQIGEPFDRNGKKYITVKDPCPRCGGSKVMTYYAHVDNGICFKCGGTGYFLKDVRVYSEKEYAAAQKAKERRAKKANEKLHKAQAEWAQKHGFNEQNTTFIFLSGNTYDIKDELKAEGYKYDGEIGWHGPAAYDAEGYRQAEVKFEDMYEFAPYGYHPDFIGEDLIKEMRDAVAKEMSTSEYVGEIGERLRGLMVTFEGSRGFDGAYGYTYVYTFKYGDNILNWFTTKELDLDEGQYVSLTGTVKKHEVYRNECVTYVNRCKVVEA